MAVSTLLKCKGLHTFANQLGMPEGALLEAKNVVINRNDIIEPRRGFALYGNSFGSTVQRSKQLLSYKSRILRHYDSKLQYDSNGTGTFADFTGTITEVESGLRIKGLEANGNFYFTTSDGIKKISISSENDLASAQITDAGGIKSLDGEASLNATEGFFTQNSKVAYRIVWGIKDANNNLILGYPSERIILSNSILDLLIKDFNNLLATLDEETKAGGINSQDYLNALKAGFGNTTPSVLKTKLLGLGQKIDDDTVLTETSGLVVSQVAVTSNVATITFSSGDPTNFVLPGYYVKVTGFTVGSAPDCNGIFKITQATSNSISFNIVHANFTQADTATVQRLKYTVGDFRETQETEVPISTSYGEIKNNYGYVEFASDITAYISIGDTVTISGFTTTGLTQLNGNHVVTGIHKVSGALARIQFQLITADVARAADFGGNAIVNHSTLDLTLSSNVTTAQLEALQNFYNNYITELSNELSGIATGVNYSGLSAIQSATVNLSFTIPAGITTSHFYQVYRSPLLTAEGVTSLDDLDAPSDEMNLVYEANPTVAEISAQSVTTHDIYPDDLRAGSAYLYTNPNSGEGIAQANEVPPLAKDITSYKNYIFYGNTQTKHRLTLNMLGTAGFTSGVSYIKISNSVTTQTYTFVEGVAQEIEITTIPGSDFASSGPADYCDIYSAKNKTQYRIWFKRGTATAPSGTGVTLVEIDIAGTETADEVATEIYRKLNIYNDFVIDAPTADNISILNSSTGICNGPTENVTDPDFTVTVITAGAGEDSATNKIEIPTSSSLTSSQKIDQCARSLVRVINKTASNLVYAYYISGADDVPGKILLENRSLGASKFFVVCNNSTSGGMFEPDMSPIVISAISAANPAAITCTTPHRLSTNQSVYIFNSNSTPVVDGVRTVTVTDSTHFTVPVTTTVTGNAGLIAIEGSDNEIKLNRLYYSKAQQPEAVPMLNYINVGPEDKKIVRILGLRDSLFIIKEEAVYRLSGDGAPFTVAPIDSSTQIKGADSAVILNNQIYMTSNQGVATISETGVSIISRPIENLLVKLSTYAGFSSATFGVPYESDRSYYLFTIQAQADTVAKQCFRYNTFTDSWSLLDLSKTCGIVNFADDKLYLGASDTNYIERERKDFSRTDYTDREYSKNLDAGSYRGTKLRLNSVNDVEVGDSLVQIQYLTVRQFNRLLEKLDNDSGIVGTDYTSSLECLGGEDLRDRLTKLADKLDADAGTVTKTYASSIVGFGSTFIQTQSAFNVIINTLNADEGVGYSNYILSSGTVVYEIDITDIDKAVTEVTLSKQYPFIVGPLTIFKRINCAITWAPQPLDDASVLKQVREATVLFENDAFTSAITSFATDLSPDFYDIDFLGSGNGVFGSSNWGEFVFGGSGTSAPFRTFVPQNKQRCRYIKTRFEHAVARETFAVYGISYTYESNSSRAYK